MIGWSCDDEGEVELDSVDSEVVCRDHAFWPLDRPICHSEFDVRRKHFWAPPLTPTFVVDYAYRRSSVYDRVTRRASDTNWEGETSVVALDMRFTYIYQCTFRLCGYCGRMRDVPWLDVDFEHVFECELYFFGEYKSSFGIVSHEGAGVALYFT